jgi:hypothetical protein
MAKIEVRKYQQLEHIISMGVIKIGVVIFVLLLVVLAIVVETK